MEEKTVMQISGADESAADVGNESSFDFDEGSVDAGFAEDDEAGLLGEEQQESETQTAVADQSAAGVGGQGQKNNHPQKSVGQAFKLERQRQEDRYKSEYERKLANDPVYAAGQRLINDIMLREGKTYDEAVALSEERWIEAIAKRENISTNVARMLLKNQQMQSPATPKPQAVEKAPVPDVDDQVIGIIEDLIATPKPEGFDIEAAMQDETFRQLLVEMAPAAAIRVYQAERIAKQTPQDLAEKLRGRQLIPQSIRPQQAAAPIEDWNQADDKTFWAEKERRRKNR